MAQNTLVATEYRKAGLSRQRLADVIHPRAEEIFELVQQDLRNVGIELDLHVLPGTEWRANRENPDQWHVIQYTQTAGDISVIDEVFSPIRNVTPAVATSYAYVNPVVAVLLGTGFGGESLSLIEWLALAVIIFAVVLVTLGKYLFPARSEATPCKAAK